MPFPTLIPHFHSHISTFRIHIILHQYQKVHYPPSIPEGQGIAIMKYGGPLAYKNKETASL